MNYVRTAILLAGLTALFMGVGYLIGGGSGQTLSPGSDYPLELQRAEKVKAALGVDGRGLTQTAIRFALASPKVSTVLVGFSNTTHIDDAVACSGAPAIPEESMARLRALWQSDFGKLTA